MKCFQVTTTTEPTRQKVTNKPNTAPPKTQPTKHQPAQQKQPPSSGTNQLNDCEGECVSGLFALFCDDIDTDAYCPGEASCCVTGGSNNNEDEKIRVPTTQRPTTPVIFKFKNHNKRNILITNCRITIGTIATVSWFLFAKYYGCFL